MLRSCAGLSPLSAIKAAFQKTGLRVFSYIFFCGKKERNGLKRTEWDQNEEMEMEHHGWEGREGGRDEGREEGRNGHSFVVCLALCPDEATGEMKTGAARRATHSNRWLRMG